MADVTDNDEVMGILNDWVNGTIDDEEADAHLFMAASSGDIDWDDYHELRDEMEIDF
jgi:hypothetical protein